MADEKTFSFILGESAAHFIVMALGDLPTKTGAFPILQSLQMQIQMQVNAIPAASEEIIKSAEKAEREIHGKGADLSLDI